MTVTPLFAVWKAAIQVVWAAFIEDAPLPVSVPFRPDAEAAPVEAAPVFAGVPSLAAQADKARAEAVRMASGAPIFESFKVLPYVRAFGDASPRTGRFPIFDSDARETS